MRISAPFEFGGLGAVAQQNPWPADEVIEKTFQLRRLD
jgi:hypothetical protein